MKLKKLGRRVVLKTILFCINVVCDYDNTLAVWTYMIIMSVGIFICASANATASLILSVCHLMFVMLWCKCISIHNRMLEDDLTQTHWCWGLWSKVHDAKTPNTFCRFDCCECSGTREFIDGNLVVSDEHIHAADGECKSES